MNGTPTRRYALGLPSGSVRAILTLLIVGIVCALLLIMADNSVRALQNDISEEVLGTLIRRD